MFECPMEYLSAALTSVLLFCMFLMEKRLLELTHKAKTWHVTEFLLQKMVLFPTDIMSCDSSFANKISPLSLIDMTSSLYVQLCL